MRDDEWALDVRGRLEFVQDLHAADVFVPPEMQCKFSHVKSDPSCIFPTIEKGKNASRKKIYIDGKLFICRRLPSTK
jgi:hypothetical protein